VSSSSVAQEGGEESKPNAHAALLQFASAAEEEMTLSDELEGIIRNLAETGAAACYPWDALRILLAKKMETVLTDFWNDAPDLTLSEGETFQHSAVEPLKQSLLEPRREGAPWTTQRLCELLAQPRTSYKSTRKFMYALQRAILITATEEAIAPRSAPVLQLSGPGGLLPETLEGRPTETTTAAAISAAATLPPESEGVAVLAEAPKEGGAESGTPASTPTARKRKLPEELANGVVEE